jgi:hypothetical protein
MGDFLCSPVCVPSPATECHGARAVNAAGCLGSKYSSTTCPSSRENDPASALLEAWTSRAGHILEHGAHDRWFSGLSVRRRDLGIGFVVYDDDVFGRAASFRRDALSFSGGSDFLQHAQQRTPSSDAYKPSGGQPNPCRLAFVPPSLPT